MQGDRAADNPYMVRYRRMQAKPMEVISHLYYRMCVRQLPAEDRLDAMRSWTGGARARVPAQRREYVDPAADPPLTLEHVLEVMEWLFTEMQTDPDAQVSDACYLNRLQCVNAQAIAAGWRNTKHRPFDMLAAVFLCADWMPGTAEEKRRLRGYEHTFMQMYVNVSQVFDYRGKDVYAHDRVAG